MIAGGRGRRRVLHDLFAGRVQRGFDDGLLLAPGGLLRSVLLKYW